MPKFRVPVFRSATKTVEVEQGSTRGATLGVNLYDSAGNVLTLAALIALIGDAIDIPVPSTEPPLTVWGNLGEVPSDALSVLGNPTNATAKPIAIVAGNNDRVLRRVANVLDWGFLTAGMFPDSMVTVLSGTEFEIQSDLVDLHSQVNIAVQAGTPSPLVIDGSTGSTTRPAISILNQSSQANRRALAIYETDASGRGFWLQADLSGEFGDNFIEFGADYTSGGDAANAFRIYADGRLYGTGATEGQSTLLWTPTAAGDPTFALTATAGIMHMTIAALEDATLTIAADTSNTAGAGEDWNPTLRFLQDGGNVAGYFGLAGTAGTDSFGNTFTNGFANALTINVTTDAAGGQVQFGAQGAIAFHIASDRTVSVQRGNTFRIYDSANTDFVAMSHNGTNFLETFTNTTSIVWSGITGLTVPSGFAITTGGGTFSIIGTGETLATFADDGAVVLYHNNTIRIQTSANGVEIPGGSSLRIQDAANTDYGQFAHDGTNFLTTFVNTTKWDITVGEVELNGDLDLDGIFDNDQTRALGGGAAATLGTIGGTGPTAAAQSEWLRIRINGTDRWLAVWA